MTDFYPDTATFTDNYTKGKSQVVWCEIPADLETPLSSYLKITEDQNYSFLLESVEGGATLGRYSFIGCNPDMLWKCDKNTAYTALIKNGVPQEYQPEPDAPLDSLRRHLEPDIIIPDNLPPSCVGLFGYLGYDMARQVEDIPRTKHDELNIPDAIMTRPKVLVVFDNVKQTMIIGTPVWNFKNIDAQAAYEGAIETLTDCLKKLQGPIPALPENIKSVAKPPQSNITQNDFYKMVETAKEYIFAGDIFQVVLSQRFKSDFANSALSLYRSLRRLNPSPFLFYLNLGEFQMVGSSPEILVRVRDNTVTIRPIAGTRKRGKDTQEDQALAHDLLNDPKERAEHLMLLDLGRNDVGRVSEIGSVNVTEQYTIENYSHVMHIVSNVEGQLKAGYDGLDALFSGFPAGTVSGAPKIRAMQIIDELEPVERKFYAGCVGYLGFDGSVDSCITLRTGLVKDGTLYVQAGGGIVAGSTPDGEYQESINKAKALFVAAENISS